MSVVCVFSVCVGLTKKNKYHVRLGVWPEVSPDRLKCEVELRLCVRACMCLYLLSVDTAVMLRTMCTSEGGRRAKSRDDLRAVTAPAGDFSDMTTRRSLQRLRNPPNLSCGG